MRLRIKSDGTARGTRLETETGEQIHGVMRIDWHVAVGKDESELAEAVVTLHALVPLDVNLEGANVRFVKPLPHGSRA